MKSNKTLQALKNELDSFFQIRNWTDKQAMENSMGVQQNKPEFRRAKIPDIYNRSKDFYILYLKLIDGAPLEIRFQEIGGNLPKTRFQETEILDAEIQKRTTDLAYIVKHEQSSEYTTLLKEWVDFLTEMQIPLKFNFDSSVRYYQQVSPIFPTLYYTIGKVCGYVNLLYNDYSPDPFIEMLLRRIDFRLLGKYHETQYDREQMSIIYNVLCKDFVFALEALFKHFIEVNKDKSQTQIKEILKNLTTFTGQLKIAYPTEYYKPKEHRVLSFAQAVDSKGKFSTMDYAGLIAGCNEFIMHNVLKLYGKLIESLDELLKYANEGKPEIPVTIISGNKKLSLTLNQIALIYAYKNIAITRDNGNSIAKEYGHTSGAGLFNRFTGFSSHNRRAKPFPFSRKKLENKITLFESITEHLTGQPLKLALDEINILKSLREDD